MKKVVLLAFVLLFLSTAMIGAFIRPVEASGTIYISSDYTFTSNIYEPIVVTADNIIIDGAGYTVQGTGTGWGITLDFRNNVTLKNVEVTNFEYGIVLSWSSNNVLANNTASNNSYGIELYFSKHNNILTGNTASNNNIGIYLEFSRNNTLFHNNFIYNERQAVNEDSVNTWDDGYPSGGNYWSDYTGMDQNGDGIGDTPYEIDENNQDNYPLMNQWIPEEEEEGEEEVPFWMQWWLWVIVAVVIVALAGAVYFLKKRKPPTPTAPPPPTEGTLQNITQNTNSLNSYLSFLL